MHLYTLSEATVLNSSRDRFSVEREFFQEIDNDAAVAFAALLTGGVNALDERGRNSWAVFLNSLHERRPRLLAEMDARAKAILDRAYEHLQAGSDPEGRERFSRIMSDEVRAGMARNEVRYEMMRRIREPKTIGRLLETKWRIVNNLNPEFEFITTDSPLIVNCGRDEPAFATLVIALDPQKLFFLYPSDWSDDASTRETLGLMAVVHNPLLLDGDCQFIYSRTKLEDGDFIRIRRGAELFLKQARRTP